MLFGSGANLKAGTAYVTIWHTFPFLVTSHQFLEDVLPLRCCQLQHHPQFSWKWPLNLSSCLFWRTWTDLLSSCPGLCVTQTHAPWHHLHPLFYSVQNPIFVDCTVCIEENRKLTGPFQGIGRAHPEEDAMAMALQRTKEGNKFSWCSYFSYFEMLKAKKISSITNVSATVLSYFRSCHVERVRGWAGHSLSHSDRRDLHVIDSNHHPKDIRHLSIPFMRSSEWGSVPKPEDFKSWPNRFQGRKMQAQKFQRIQLRW